jgi:hypothetical protein
LELVETEWGRVCADVISVALVEEVPMSHGVRVDLANPAELLELPGVAPEQARAILDFRA